MQKSKIFSVLKTLTATEIKEFSKYLYGLYKGKQSLLKLFDYIRKYHPKYDSPKLGKEYAWQKIFGSSTAYNYNKLMEALSDLNLKAKEFIVWKNLKKESFERDWILLNHFRERKAEASFSSLWEKMDTKYGKEHNWGSANRVRLNTIRYFETTIDSQNLIKSQAVLRTAGRELDIFFAQMRLMISSEMKSRSVVRNESYNFIITDDFHKNIGLYRDVDIVNFRSVLYEFMKSPNRDTFIELKNELFDTWKTKSENYLTVSYLMNFAVQQLQTEYGNEFMRHLFELFKFGDERDLFLVEGYMPAVKFNNGVSTALALEDPEWAKDFIQRRKDFLEESIKEDTISLSYGNIYFNEKNYPKALEMLQKQDFKNTIYNIIARKIITQTLWETDADYEIQLSHSKAFEQYLRRNKHVIRKEFFESHLNFTLISRRILSGKIKNAEELSEILNQTPLCVQKPWLSEKIHT